MAQVPFFGFIPKEILLPVDFSPSSRSALDTAVDLALHFHSELILVNIVPCFSTFALTYSVPDVVLEQKMEAHAEQLLAKCCATLDTRGITSRYCVKSGNNPAENIVEIVEREHIDLLIISTHGTSGWHPLVFGSVAEKVVNLVQCPILLLRSAQSEKNAPPPTAQHNEWM